MILDDIQNEGSIIGDSGVAPNPFTVTEIQTSEMPKEESGDETWKRWDEG